MSKFGAKKPTSKGSFGNITFLRSKWQHFFGIGNFLGIAILLLGFYFFQNGNILVPDRNEIESFEKCKFRTLSSRIFCRVYK